MSGQERGHDPRLYSLSPDLILIGSGDVQIRDHARSGSYVRGALGELRPSRARREPLHPCVRRRYREKTWACSREVSHRPLPDGAEVHAVGPGEKG